MSTGGGKPDPSSPLGDTSDDVTRVTPVKRRRLLPLVDLRGAGGMTSSSVELGGPSAPQHLPLGLHASASLGHGRRSRTPLTDLDSKFVTKSGFCGAVDVGESGSFRGVGVGTKKAHLIGSSSGVAGASSGDDSLPRFPRLDQCAHFHYEYVELPPIQVILVSEELKPLSQGVCSSEDSENRSLLVQVSSLGRSWVVRRTYDNFRFLDRQLHRCCYDRKYSQLPELPPEENLPGVERETAVETVLRAYLRRLSDVAGSLITCGPVLSWLELDNRGHRLIVTDDSDINTPAVAAAYVVKRYTAQASDEISFEVGDMISVIDMPPPEESIWWRGKRGFQVGFFPCECVQVIGDKVPHAIHAQTITLPHPRSAGSTPPSHAQQPHAAIHATTSLSSNSTTEPIKPVLRKHGKLIAFFRSFILSRPSRRKLKQSGILRERVFGCDLGEHLLNSGHEIPMVLKCCAEFVETHGTVDGIYRLSGITSNIQKLRHAFDEERVPDLYGDESILQDIHCVSSVLKMYFRELPNPLLTYQLYDKFVTAVMQNEDVRLLHVRDVVQQLPPPHYRTLEYLIQHLARIAAHSSDTGMTPRNIAIVWAPNLLRSKDLEKGGVAALQDVGTQAVVTEYLVRYVDLIFNDRIPVFSPSTNGFEGTPKKSRPKSLAISTPTKLLSIDEARNRALMAIKSDQKYIEVGGGPQNLPKTYHTVIDLPCRKGGSLKQKKSPLGWKTIFSKNRHQRKASTPNEVSLNVSDSVVTESDLSSHTTKKLRPVKSVESLVSTPVSLHSNYSSQAAAATGNKGPHTVKIPEGAVRIGRSNSSSSESGSVPSPRTHNRSVSHDSYFNSLERNGSSEVSPQKKKKRVKEIDLEFSPESSKIFLDISELNIDFNTSEAEMKIFSEDDTLKSTSMEDTLSRSTVDMENVSMNSDCTRSKENVSSGSRDTKRSLKEKLKQKFTSPSAQRKETNVSDTAEESGASSLKRVSASFKDKLVQALSPETARKKVENSCQQLPSPCESPESTVIQAGETEEIAGGGREVSTTFTGSKDQLEEGHILLSSDLLNETNEPESRGSIESALIDPELLDKLTHMRVSSSEASSASLAEATVSDNESFTLGSSSNDAAAGFKEGGGSDSASTVPQSSRTTPCTPPVTIVADSQFQEEIVMRGRANSSHEDIAKEEPKSHLPPRDRPSSLIGITMNELSVFSSTLTSPETPQGDSIFLDIQYHPLSDTTEPSSPSESHADVEGEIQRGEHLADIPRHSCPLSPDLSSSSTDDPIENGPVYENMELSSLYPLTSEFSNLYGSSNKESTSSSLRQSPDLETPTVEEQEVEYENIAYSHLAPGEDDIVGSSNVTPCYENLGSIFSLEQSYENLCTSREPEIRVDVGMYENIGHNEIKNVNYHPGDDYEEVSFREKPKPEYTNLEICQEGKESEKTEAEIEGEVVYQQVKYLRQSIQEVNNILSENSDTRDDDGIQPCDQSEAESGDNNSRNDLDIHPTSEGSECLESPVTPSSSSLVTEVLVLPSFSSPTESTTEEATSPEASEAQNSPKLSQETSSPSPTDDTSIPTVVPSPCSVHYFLPSLSPPSPEVSSADLSERAASVVTQMKFSPAFIPSPYPRSGTRHTQVWPPVPKPRSLPALNLNSPVISPVSTPSSNLSISPDSPATSGTLSDESEDGNHPEDQDPASRPYSSHPDEVVEREKSTCVAIQEKVPPSVITIEPASLGYPCKVDNETESQKRERIERYKEERRNYLREKYKSESFKGEKDEMILRLKQKATSPSRLEEDDNAMADSNAKSHVVIDERLTEDKQDKQGLMATAMQFHSSTSNLRKDSLGKTSLGFKNKSEPSLHRSISEDSAASDRSQSDSSRVLSVSTESSKSCERHSQTEPDAIFHKSYERAIPEDDVNVRKRVAIWNQQDQGALSLPSSKQEGARYSSNSKVRAVSSSTKASSSDKPRLKKVQVSPGSKLSDPFTYPSFAVKPLLSSVSVETPPVTYGKSETLVPRIHKEQVRCYSDSTKERPECSPVASSFTKSAPQSPVKRSQVLLSQKSEGDLRVSIPLKPARSYSVEASAFGPSSKVRTSNQQTRIKDMKALFEKESPTSDFNRPFPLRQTSKGGV